MNLTYRKAQLEDVSRIVELLMQDDLGKERESKDANLDRRYIEAFAKIDSDPNQYVMVVEGDNCLLGTCHLTIMPSLTFKGSTRMNIEAVRIDEKYRGQKIGEQMINEAINYGKNRDVSIIQLTTNKKRPRAKNFYEKIGFNATHEGMKLVL